jgi:hypothetical protein
MPRVKRAATVRVMHEGRVALEVPSAGVIAAPGEPVEVPADIGRSLVAQGWRRVRGNTSNTEGSTDAKRA